MRRKYTELSGPSRAVSIGVGALTCVDGAFAPLSEQLLSGAGSASRMTRFTWPVGEVVLGGKGVGMVGSLNPGVVQFPTTELSVWALNWGDTSCRCPPRSCPLHGAGLGGLTWSQRTKTWPGLRPTDPYASNASASTQSTGSN